MLIPVCVVLVALSCGRSPIFTVDVEEVVHREGDFPAGPAATVRTVDPTADWRCDKWRELQWIDSQGSPVRSADVVVFTDKREANKAFDEFAGAELPATMRIVGPPDVGARIVAYEGPDDDGEGSIALVFRRCYAVASIRARLKTDPAVRRESVGKFADGLDRRLIRAYCPIYPRRSGMPPDFTGLLHQSTE